MRAVGKFYPLDGTRKTANVLEYTLLYWLYDIKNTSSGCPGTIITIGPETVSVAFVILLVKTESFLVHSIRIALH